MNETSKVDEEIRAFQSMINVEPEGAVMMPMISPKPSPVPSESTNPSSTPTTDPSQTKTPEKEVLGPVKTGKTLADLATSLGVPKSWSVLLDDMQEAVLGIIGDLTGKSQQRVSLADVLSYKNRLRGIGMLFILVAIVGILLEAIVGDSLR